MTDRLISLQAAVDALKDLEFCHYMEFGEYIGEDTREVRLIRAEKAWDALQNLPSAQPDFDITVKIDKAYDDGYEAGYLQGKHDWGDLDE